MAKISGSKKVTCSKGHENYLLPGMTRACTGVIRRGRGVNACDQKVRLAAVKPKKRAKKAS